MAERVTIQDIADALGVSRNTVSKAINNTGILADATREKVLKKAMEIIDGRAEVEVSGNVTKENISRLTDLGVDIISSGALTHSAPILDISLKNLHAV